MLVLAVWFICFVFSISAFNFSISWSLGWLFVSVDCYLEGDLDLFLLVCFALNDFSCCCKVGLSLILFVVLFVGGIWLMFRFKAFPRRVTRGEEGGGGWGGWEVALPCDFRQTWKKCPNLEKKCPDCDHLWVKFLI